MTRALGKKYWPLMNADQEQIHHPRLSVFISG
jgi:hypothetical protein